nr:hypothetical protein [Bacilli bacterium]
MRKHFLGLLLLPLLCLTSCGNSQEVTFYCTTSEFETYYDDSYFLQDAREYHQDIALASHAMAIATFASKDYINASNNIRNLLKDEGFTDISCNVTMYEKPNVNTIGYTFGRKTIVDENNETYTLIPIAIRGGNYEAEWSSNVRIGYEEDAHGFSYAAKAVFEGLQEYVSSHFIVGRLKLWIAGYSRAAITSNILGGRILEKIDNNTLILSTQTDVTLDNVFVYCFEPPLGTVKDPEVAHSALYNNINNLLNYNDPVPLVAPIAWGFNRYGVDRYYPDRLTDINFDKSSREKFVTLYHFMGKKGEVAEYTVDDWEYFAPGEFYGSVFHLPLSVANPSIGRFARDFINGLAVTGIGSREKYASTIQQGLERIFAVAFGRDQEFGSNFGFSFDIIGTISQYQYLKLILNELINGQEEEFMRDFEPLFHKILGGTVEKYFAVRGLYQELAPMLGALCKSFTYRRDVALQFSSLNNLSRLVQCHYPNLSYAC